MKRAIRVCAPCLCCAAILIGSCTTTPITGRERIALVPSFMLTQMSFQNYRDFLSESELSKNAADTQMVKRAGKKISQAVEKHFRDTGMSDSLEGYKWEFSLIEDPTVNAWCMPGGKVAVYTGILPVARDEAGLAVVMGHEIAHAVAEHGNERMTHGLLTELGGKALSVALKEKPQETKDLFMKVYGVTTEVGVLLPYSRLHELEADRLGLIFMAMAGYDPNRAVDFWQEMKAMKTAEAPPEFLSTHPSDDTRIAKIKSLLPEAMPYYKADGTR